jgi:hypothetical protein
MNEVLKVDVEECCKVRTEWDEMTDVERNASGCALIKVLAHLRGNLEDAKKDPTYRRREIKRSKIALRAITGLVSQFKVHFDE